MCLALPAEVIRIDGEFAVVKYLISRQQGRVAVTEGLEVKEGDQVLVHAGFAYKTVGVEEADDVVDELIWQVSRGRISSCDIGLG